MKKLIRSLLLLLVVVIAFLGGYGYRRWFGKDPNPGAGRKAERRILYYVDPMNPAYKSDKPGKALDGMDLVPFYEESKSDSVPGNGMGSSSSGDASSMPMGTIKISPQKQQLIGVQYGTVESTRGVQTIRAVGKVAFDETRIARVHPKVEGWVDKVFVDFTGKLVEKGQPLLTFYSPEMLATEQEFLLALKGKELLKNSTLRGVPEQNDSLVAAARKRLELWDLSESQIDEIARSQEPVKNVTLDSPIRGYVITRNAFPRQRIMPDTELYTVVDLNKIWIMADVFEYEASMVRIDQRARVSLSYQPGKSFAARVDYIQPQVDPMTRTLKIRLEAENLDLVLKPDMFVDVEFRVEMPRQILVPSDAVLNSGLRQTVFVDRGNGFLEPRQVEIGQRLGDRLEIRKGLQPGERIVISGNFLIDSESQLKSAAGGMAGMQHGGSTGGKAKESTGGMEGMPGMEPGGSTGGKPKESTAPAPGGHEGHGGAPSSQPQQSGGQHSGGHQQ